MTIEVFTDEKLIEWAVENEFEKTATRRRKFMKIKDKNGTCIFIQQAKNGKIIIPIGNTFITLDKSDAEKFTLYDIEDFDVELYKKAYS